MAQGSDDFAFYWSLSKQIVWADSNKIGCGMATCPNAEYKYYAVCQYSPP